MFDKFKIFKDNWEEIRDEVLSNGLDIFQNNPNCECTWGVAPNGVPVSLGFMLCIGNEPLEEHIKLFPKTWKLYNELDIPSKQSIGFGLLQPRGVIDIHADPEDCYRYHICLQSENNKANIYGTKYRNTKTDLYINESEEIMLDPGLMEHGAINKSSKIVRIHLAIDYLSEEKSIERYNKGVGVASDWLNFKFPDKAKGCKCKHSIWEENNV